MIEVKYVSANGTEIEMLGSKLRVTDGSLHSIKWTPVVLNRVIGASLRYFKKDPVVYELTLTLRGDLEERYAKLDEITDILDRDVNNGTLGRLYFGDYYIECVRIESKTAINKDLNSRTDKTLNFWCPYPNWIKEHAIVFDAINGSDTTIGGLDFALGNRGRKLENTWWGLNKDEFHSGLWLYHDADIQGTMYEYEMNVGQRMVNDTGSILLCYIYSKPRSAEPWEEPVKERFTLANGEEYFVRHHCYILCDKFNVYTSKPNTLWDYDFPIDYGSVSSTHKDLSIQNSGASNFKMIMHGPCINPTVNINGHIYAVNTSINAGEYIVIDSVKRTVLLYSGPAVINLFDLRYKKSDIFEPINTDQLSVSWGGGFKFDLVLYLERSEPRWLQ